MKTIIWGFVLMAGGFSASAQFGSAVTTMLQQIAALQAYIQVAEKGYAMAENGIHTIRDIKNGEFNLHSVFFTSLSAVSPKVANMAEVAEITSLQASLVSQFSHKLTGYRQNGWLQAGEISYIGQVYTTLVNTTQAEITTLSSLLTDGDLIMTDGERLKAIRAIDEDTKQQYRFAQLFTNQADMLALQRQQEGNR